MDQSRRAVEAYWRSKLIDTVTSDEDKVAPVYKLEEVCELLRNSTAGIVKEVSDYALKRLDHKSPIVKQKALRLIKYAVGKSGSEFRREMQRHSAVMRQLCHYKGQPDPLKGDALNKAVRETANETIAAVFATDDSKAVAPVESLGKRIQGFGNTNFEPQTEDKKSFLTEVVGMSGASIIQGLTNIAAAHSSSLRNDDTGSYRSPNLRRSLTTEIDIHNENGGSNQSWGSSGSSKTQASGTWGSDSRANVDNAVTVDDTASSNSSIKSREERLLETIVTSGGVRLQPTRDTIQVFLTEALKLDAVAMSRAIDLKLQSHLWQVRMKAICVLEAILRKKDDEHFSIVASYFSENIDSLVKCTEVPQVSLREKASKVLSLLDDEQASGTVNVEQPKAASVPAVQMPDLIDTGDFDDSSEQTSVGNPNEQGATRLQQAGGSLVDDLFGSNVLGDLTTIESRHESDPFADVSFHSSEGKEQNDLFSGLTVDERSDIKVNSQSPELLDVFGSNSEQLMHGTGKDAENVNDLMSGLNLSADSQGNNQHGVAGASGGAFSGLDFLNNSSQPNNLPANGALNANFALNNLYSQAPMQYNLPPAGFNQSFPTQPLNYGAMGAFIAQQQLLLQNLGNYGTGFVQPGNSLGGGNYSSALPDIFHLSSNPVQNQAPVVTNTKKEDTKAFDFITDHIAAARDSKRVL